MPEFRGRKRLCITDEERKERVRASKRKWNREHTEYFRDYFVERYHQDAEFKEKMLAKGRKNYEKARAQKDELKEQASKVVASAEAEEEPTLAFAS